MAVTKVNSVGLDWLALAAATIRGAGASGTETSTVDLSTSLRSGLTITVGHTDGNANANGVEVIVQVKYSALAEDWRTLYTLRMGAGTATIETLNDAAVEAAETTFVTTGTSMSTQGEQWLILDGTDLNVEVVRQRSISTNTVTIVDALTLSHTNGLSLSNEVTEKYLPIPDDVSTVRVLFNNDDADAAMIVRVDVAKLTAAA